MQDFTDKPVSVGGVPIVPLLLGWAGVVPLAALVMYASLGPSAHAAAAISALVAYGSIILSFMGGVLWGLEMSQGRSKTAYVVSVIPALMAAATMAFQAPFGILLLLCSFAGLLAYDITLSRSGKAPSWYRVLRSQLTAAVVVLLSTALLFAWHP